MHRSGICQPGDHSQSYQQLEWAGGWRALPSHYPNGLLGALAAGSPVPTIYGMLGMQVLCPAAGGPAPLSSLLGIVARTSWQGWGQRPASGPDLALDAKASAIAAAARTTCGSCLLQGATGSGHHGEVFGPSFYGPAFWLLSVRHGAENPHMTAALSCEP